MRYQSTTGLAREELIEVVARVHEILESRGESLSAHALGLFRQVEVALTLLRNNLSQALMADLCEVSQPTISRIYRRMVPLIGQALQFTGISLEQAVRQRHLLLVDGTYIPTGNRPAHGRELEKANYSGKHHCQCLTIQVASAHTGELIAVSDPLPGSRHDSRALAESGWAQILEDGKASWIADSAYCKYSALTPIKKSKNRERLDWEIECNRNIASYRAPIEHAISHLKNWKILSTGYRGRLRELPEIIAIITKLERYRLGW